MSDLNPPVRPRCLTPAELAEVQEGAPGGVPERLARHLAECESCQERALSGSGPRRRRRGREGSVLPTPMRALLLLGVMLLVMIAFFFTLSSLIGKPSVPPPTEAPPSTGSSAPFPGAESG